MAEQLMQRLGEPTPLWLWLVLGIVFIAYTWHRHGD